MIFNRFFKPKYQHLDPQIRIQAIASLSPDDAQQKSVLHELAFNDGDASVVIAALVKLDNFALWCKAADTSKQDRVVKKARGVVEQALLTGQGISAQERIQFVQECQQNPLLETLLNESWLRDDQPDLAYSVLQRLNKPQITQKVALSTTNEALQLRIVDATQDESVLNRFARKLQNPPLVELIQARLSEIETLKAKPAAIEAETKLVLSKLQALKDQDDCAKVLTAKESLEKQFVSLQAEFVCLNADVQASLKDKFHQISARVRSQLDTLRPAYEKSQALATRVAAFNEHEAKLAEITAKIDGVFKGDIAQVTLGDIDTHLQGVGNINDALADIGAKLSAEHPDLHRRVEAALNRVFSLQSQLSQLPSLQSALIDADAQLAELETLEPPVDSASLESAETTLKDQSNAWKNRKADFATVWPADRNQAFNTWRNNWQQAIKSIRDDVQDKTQRCRSKLRVVESLIEQGRYRAAMSNWQKLLLWYPALPESAQRSLTRNFDKVKLAIENLKDWQDYIASPRKPALVEQAKQLADTPYDDIDEQAKAVKQLRSEWTSLGPSNSADDDSLNAEFNGFLDAAFEPCRQFYEAQKNSREENFTRKTEIIAECHDMADSGVSGAELLAAYRNIQDRWRAVGHVDYDKRDQIFEAYRTALGPVKIKVDAFLSDNAEQKAMLVKRAEALADLGDVQEAVEKALQLQEQWKSIKTAGKRQDNVLWKQFRSANDRVFEKRNAIRNQQQQAEKAELDSIQQHLESLEARFTLESGIADLYSLLSDIGQAEQQLNAKDKRQSGFRKRVSDLQKRASTRITELEHSRARVAFERVFESVAAWTGPEAPDSAMSLPSEWRQCFSDVASTNAREDITIRMEIIANKASPEKSLSRRRELQLQLMADKLEKGEEQDLDTLLKQWINQGPMQEGDLERLSRVKSLYA